MLISIAQVFRVAMVFALGLTVRANAEESRADMGLKFEPDGTAVVWNSLLEIKVNNQNSRNDGIRGWKYKPTGYEMVDVLYHDLGAGGGHLLGMLWDPATIGSFPIKGPEVGGLFVPVVAGVTKDERAIVLEQQSQGKYRLTRTMFLRRDYSGVETKIRLENLEADPSGFALRLHNVLSPGARGQYQSVNDLLFLPGEKARLTWQQNLPMDKFKESNAGFAIRSDFANFPPSNWSQKANATTPLLNGNWLAQVNPENGDGLVMFVNENAFLGCYNAPETTVEPLLKGVSLQRGQSWETTVFLCAFGGASGNSFQGATPLYAILTPLKVSDGRLTGEVSPIFSGRLRVADAKAPSKALAEYQAKAMTPIRVDVGVPSDWLLVALDGKGEEIGRVAADGSVKMFEPQISREKKDRPKVEGTVFQLSGEETGIRDMVKARDFAIQCDWNESEPVRALAEKTALQLGVGMAWTPRYPGKMISFGSAQRSTTVRNAGLLKQSVDAGWPGVGRGAILAYANFESTARPLVLVAGSDDEGALAAARTFYDKYVKSVPVAKGFDFWASPVSELGMVWARPTTGTVLDSIEINSARNEYESAQVILTPYEALSGVEVTVDPLIHAVSGKPISQNFSNPFRKRFGPLRVRWAESYPLKAEEGWPGIPDALLSRPVTVLPAGRSQVLWLTTLVANDAEPGLYRSAIHVKAGGESRSIPIQLNVNAFTLPLTGLKGEAYMSMDTMSPTRRLRETDVQRLITTLVEHRFRIISLKEPEMIRWHVSPEGKFKGIQTDFLQSNDDGTLLMDTTRFDWLQTKCDQYAKPVELEFNVPLLDVIGWANGSLPAFKNAFPNRYAGRPERAGQITQSYWSQEMLEMFRRHLEQRGLVDRVSVKVGDEPPGFDIWWNSQAQAAIASGLHFGTAFNAIDSKQAEKALGTRLNRFQPLYQQFDPEFAKRVQSAGQEIGWYNCGPPPRSGVGTSASELRSYYWQAAKYNLDFVARWGVQCWESEGTTRENVWTFRYSHHNSLLYPEHPDKPPYTEPGKGLADTAPLDSIRFELIRDGIEDADYVRVLRQLITQAKSAGKADAAHRGEAVLQSIWEKTYPTLNQYNPPYAELLDARSKVAAAILALQAELPPPATQKAAGGVKANGVKAK